MIRLGWTAGHGVAYDTRKPVRMELFNNFKAIPGVAGVVRVFQVFGLHAIACLTEAAERKGSAVMKYAYDHVLHTDIAFSTLDQELVVYCCWPNIFVQVRGRCA